MPDHVADHSACWHYATTQHAMMNHRDEVCCHCGIGRCVSMRRVRPSGHGPFFPGPWSVEPVPTEEPDGVTR